MVKQLKSWGRVGRQLLVVALGFGCAWTAQAAVRDPLPVENFSGQKGLLGQYVAEVATDQWYDAVKQRGLALFAKAYAFGEEGKEVCVAFVGLTEPAVNERLNPRIPARLFFGASTSLRPNVDDDLNSCRGVAVRRAIDSLVKEKDHDGLIAGADVTREAGQFGAEKPNPKDAWVSFLGMNGVGKEFVFSQIDEAFPAVFDYRHFQLTSYFQEVAGDNGDKVCLGVAGFTSRAPNGRSPHWPAASRANIQIARKAGNRELSDAECFDPAVKNSMSALLEMRWDQDLIRNFEVVAEKGRPVPQPAQIRNALARTALAMLETAKKRAAQAEAAAYPERPAQRPGVVTCNTRCNNGDCYRTYGDGRKTHFQARQKFNPLNSQWEFDSGSC